MTSTRPLAFLILIPVLLLTVGPTHAQDDEDLVPASEHRRGQGQAKPGRPAGDEHPTHWAAPTAIAFLA